MEDKNKEDKDKITLVYLIENYVVIRYVLGILLGIFGGLWIIFMNELFVHLIQGL